MPDIYLRQGAASPSDVVLYDPTLPSGNVFVQTISGAVTSAGSHIKTIARLLSGSVASACVHYELVARSLAGAVTSFGAVARVHTALIALAGTVNSVGANARRTAHVLAGAVTSSGAFISSRAYLKIIVGSVSSVGVNARRTIKSITAAVLSAGAHSWTVTARAYIGQIFNFTAILVRRMTVTEAITRAATAVREVVQAIMMTETMTRQVVQTGSIVRRIDFTNLEVIMTDLRVGDVGTSMEVTVIENGVPVDLSTATVKSMVFKKPDGTKVTKTASIKNAPGSDGVLKYVIGVGDLDQAGVYYLQAVVTFAGGVWASTTSEFSVVANL